MGEDWIESRNIPGDDDSKIISNYDLQSYVPVPVEGQEALLFLIQGNLEVTVAWRSDEGEELEPFVFTGGVVYQADITMKTKNGYTFAPEKSFKYYTVPVSGQPEDNFDTALRELSVTYLSVPETEQNRKKLVSNYDLQYYVPVPTTRGVPTKQITRGDMYGTVDWTWMNESTEEAVPEGFDSFKDDTVYRAEITLTVNNDYFFDQDMDFYYPQGSVTAQKIISSAESRELLRKVSVTYNPTVKATVLGEDEDSAIDLTAVIPAPVTGGAPCLIVNDLEDGTYTGVILWSPPLDGEFAASTGYTATVMLYTTPGNEFFVGSSPCRFKYTGASTVQSSPSNGTIIMVTLVFPTTTG
jgi:hypothetical protein